MTFLDLLPDDEPKQIIRVVLSLDIFDFGQDVDGEAVCLASLLVPPVHIITAR
jgi:hypothetical protein